MDKENYQKAFTLIELLVVVAIIGILAGVVLSELSSAREKGRIAAGRQFESIVYHAEGDEAVSMWDFDECSGGTATDTSGYGNNGTIGSGLSFSTDTPSGSGCSVALNGTTALVYANGSTNIPAYQFGMKNFTIAGWINPSAPSSCGGYNSIFSNWGNPVRVGVGICGLGLSYIVMDSNYTQRSRNGIAQLPLNKWSFIVMIVDRTNNKISVYLDGKSVENFDMSSLTGNLNFNGPTLSGGSWGGMGAFLQGKIDNVRVYTKTLTASEVNSLYAEGLKNHNKLAQK